MTPRAEVGSLGRAPSAARTNVPDAEARSPSAPRTIVAGAILGFPISVALLLLSMRHLNGHELRASLGGAHLPTFALGVAVISVVYVVQAARWRTISDAPEVRLTRFLEWVVGAVAVNNVIPGRAGDILRAEWLSRGTRRPRTAALSSVVVDRGLDVVTLAAILVLTYPFVPHSAWLNHFWIAGGVMGGVVSSGLLAAMVYSRRRSASAGVGLRAQLTHIARGAGTILQGRRGMKAASQSVLAWAVWTLGAWLVASSLGIALTPFEVLFVAAVLNLGVAIPSSPGFIGTYQWLAVSALGILGVSHADAFAFSVLMHAAWFVPTTLAGGALALRKLPAAVGGALLQRPSENHAA
jgi:uncharacterized membrane protein YbhN (UPF0104 family)